jgi:hypothetical protein
MKFIKPKSSKKKVTWNISENTLTILSYFSKYSQYGEEEIVDMFLENLLDDKEFVSWINKQRYNKKIEAILGECALVTNIEGETIDAEDKKTDNQER